MNNSTDIKVTRAGDFAETGEYVVNVAARSVIMDSAVDNSVAFAAAHWDSLAKSERDMADWDAKRGHFVGAYIERAKTYERCAESLWLEASTGVSHCMCHLKPRGDCPWSGMGVRV